MIDNGELGSTIRYRKSSRKSSPRNLKDSRRQRRSFRDEDKSSDRGEESSLTDLAGTDGSGTDMSMPSVPSSENVAKLVEDARKVKKYEKMLRRTKLAFFMLLLFCIIVSLGHVWVVVTVWVLQALAFRELTNVRYKDAKEQNLPWFRTFHWCLFVSATLFNKGRALLVFCKNTPYVFEYGWQWRLERYGWALENWDYITFNLYSCLFITFVLSLKKGYYKYQFSQLTWTVFSLAITMVQANGISENILEGYFWFIFPAMLIACNDTMAYFVGSFVGRKFIKRRFLRLSPKKTWEGFVGGMICTLIFSFIFSRFLAQFQWFVCPYNDRFCEIPAVMRDHEYELPTFLTRLSTSLLPIPRTLTLMPIQIHGLWLGLFSSLVAPFGGFFASGIKRAYKIKDFNNIIPGHGGIMDRIDCQFIMACYTRVHYVTWIQEAGVVTVASVLAQAAKLDLEARRALVETLQTQISAAAGASGGIGN